MRTFLLVMWAVVTLPRCGEPMQAQRQAAAVSTLHCVMTHPTLPDPGLDYIVVRYADNSASGTCAAGGVSSTFAYQGLPGSLPQTDCRVAHGGVPYTFRDDTPRVWPRVNTTSEDGGWMVYRFGPMDPAWGCPEGPFCDLEACGVSPGHCIVAGSCQ